MSVKTTFYIFKSAKIIVNRIIKYYLYLGFVISNKNALLKSKF